ALRRRNPAERRRVRHALAGTSPIDPVERVERLDAQLEAAAVERNRSEQRQVQRLRSGTDDRVRRAAAVRERRRLRECGGVEPVIDRLIEAARQRIAGAVRPADAAGSGADTVGRSAAERTAVADDQIPVYVRYACKYPGDAGNIPI